MSWTFASCSLVWVGEQEKDDRDLTVDELEVEPRHGCDVASRRAPTIVMYLGAVTMTLAESLNLSTNLRSSSKVTEVYLSRSLVPWYMLSVMFNLAAPCKIVPSAVAGALKRSMSPQGKGVTN